MIPWGQLITKLSLENEISFPPSPTDDDNFLCREAGIEQAHLKKHKSIDSHNFTGSETIPNLQIAHLQTAACLCAPAIIPKLGFAVRPHRSSALASSFSCCAKPNTPQALPRKPQHFPSSLKIPMAIPALKNGSFFEREKS